MLLNQYRIHGFCFNSCVLAIVSCRFSRNTAYTRNTHDCTCRASGNIVSKSVWRAKLIHLLTGNGVSQVNWRRPCHRNPDHIMSFSTATTDGTSRKTVQPIATTMATRRRMPPIPRVISLEIRHISTRSTNPVRDGDTRT